MRPMMLHPFAPRSTPLLLLLIALAAPAAADRKVGVAEFARGAAAARLADAAPRILGKDAEIFETDVIETGPRSFVILRFLDDAKLTLRPNSQLTVDQYLEEKAALSLHSGGIRASAGSISRTQPGSFKLETPLGTVNANGAEFDARLCENDCEKEAAKLKPEPVPDHESVVGRIGLLRGTLKARGEDGEERAMTLGGPVLEQEVLTTGAGSHALLVFRDDTRVSLQDSTEFQVQAQKYYAAKSGENEASYRLLKGGMRTLTGAIGRESPDRFRVSTPVATTGIRGTGFDLVCRGLCRSQGPLRGQLTAGGSLPDGLYSYVWQGSIFLGNAAGEFDIGTRQGAFLPDADSRPVTLPVLPKFLLDNPNPRPDQVPVDRNKLFGKHKLTGNPPGLYVRTRNGHVQLVTQEGVLDLGRNETSYTSPDLTVLIRLEEPRNFLNQDVVPVPTRVDINEDLFTLVDELDARQEYFECLCPI